MNERLSARRGAHLEAAPKPGSEPDCRRPAASAKTHRQAKRPAFDRIVLLLQGGGALGAYQAGVYEALAEADLHPDWVAGISIGAINATIIAGNPPKLRVEKLRKFWEGVTNSWFDVCAGGLGSLLASGDSVRGSINQMSAVAALHRMAPPVSSDRGSPTHSVHPPGAVEATSYYDTAQLKATLESLIDFDRVNAEHAETRLSLGAVNVRSGNMVYFDSPSQVIKPEHVMASGALPPGFPAIEIEGEHYWDGGLVSNTPLQWIAMTQQRPPDSLVFQVDLWSARGEFPRNLAEVATRQKEIQYSSRTRAFTDYFKRVAKLRHMLAVLLDELPEEMRQREEVKFLSSAADRHCRQHRAADLSGKGLRRRFQGLRILAPLDGGALAGRLPRRCVRAPPSRNFRAIKQPVRNARHLRLQP